MITSARDDRAEAAQLSGAARAAEPALGSAVSLPATAQRPVLLVNVGEWLSLFAIAALTLQPLFGGITAAAFLGLGGLLALSQWRHSGRR